MPSAIPPKSPRSHFTQQLKTVLNSLYDPLVLGNSPLVALFNLSAQPDPVKALRLLLKDAIESLRPLEDTPRGAKTGRVYLILRQRFVEQQTQRLVAENINMSTRQLQREEKLACETLSNALWRAHNLDDRLADSLVTISDSPQSNQPPPGQTVAEQTNLLQIIKSIPYQPLLISHEIQNAIVTLKGALKVNQVAIEFRPGKNDGSSRLLLPAPILRQGLLGVMGSLIAMIPGGKIDLRLSQRNANVVVKIRACPSREQTLLLLPPQTESLRYAESLIALCDGTLQTSDPAISSCPLSVSKEEFLVEIILPSADQFTVLFVEDNADTLELYRRYLAGTPYRFIGAQNAKQGMSIIREFSPQAIVIDVMMAEQDGWSLLNQLRLLADTSHTPVIVCSVLQQKNLAITLGANDFLQKPINQADLLAALGRHLGSPGTTSD